MLSTADLYLSLDCSWDTQAQLDSSVCAFTLIPLWSSLCNVLALFGQGQFCHYIVNGATQYVGCWSLKRR